MQINYININKPIYNGLSLKEIIKNLPKTFTKSEKKQYILNCIEVYKNDKSNINQGLNELIRNSNFMLINNHKKKNKHYETSRFNKRKSLQ